MKSSTKWFLIILAGLVAMGFGLTLLFLVIVKSAGGETEEFQGNGEKIAVVELQGEILSSEEIVRQFKKYREDNQIRGILFRVESPGGGVVASQEIFEEVKKTREHGKPVVVSMGALAASGGYYVSCGASRIVANPGTLTGSIGVISEFLRFDPLLSKLGIEEQTIKSGRYKDAGSPFRKLNPDDRTYFQRLMDDVHRQFISVVEKERKLSHSEVVRIADGRVFTGREAAAMGLVDTIGTYEDAIGICAKLAYIKGEPTLVKERKRGTSLFERVFGESALSDFLGMKDQLLNKPILQYRMSHGY
jgi:protease-4